MDIIDLLKKIKDENGYSFQELSQKLKFSRGYLNDVEKRRAKISKNLLEAYIKNFPEYKRQLIQLYSQELMPMTESFMSELKEGENFIDVTELMGKYEIKVYDFLSNGSGEVDLSKFVKEEFLLEKIEAEEIINKGYVFKVLGDSMKPYFLNNDVIIFKKEQKRWEELDSKLLLVKMKKKYYMRKLFFNNGQAYLHSFNERIYPEIKLEEDSELMGILYLQIKRELKNIDF